jgi:membrane protease YdiL (CAAX protease family)
VTWNWPKTWEDEQGGWWRIIVTVVLYAGFTLVGMILFTAGMVGGVREAMKGRPEHVQTMVQLFGTVLITGSGLAGVLIAVRFVHHRPVSCVFTDGGPFKSGLALQSAVLWTLLWFAGAIAVPNGWDQLTLRAKAIPWPWWAVLSVMTVSAMAVGRGTEEVVFRGYLQTRVAAWVKRPWVAACISTLIFTCIHRGNTAAYTAIALFGVAFGAACIRTGTLAPMIGLHTAHDTLESLWRPAEANAGATWMDVVFVAVALSIWFGWLVWATRRVANPTPTGATQAAIPMQD